MKDKVYKVTIDGEPDILRLAYSNSNQSQWNTSGNKSAFTFGRGQGPNTWAKNTPVKTSGKTFVIIS